MTTPDRLEAAIEAAQQHIDTMMFKGAKPLSGYVLRYPLRPWVVREAIRVAAPILTAGQEAETDCTCPDIDVTTLADLPHIRTIKGLDSRCPQHGCTCPPEGPTDPQCHVGRR